MFSGSMVALVTPFKNGGVDWQSLEGLIAFHLQNGTNGIVPCGTTGESATLSHQEHDEVIRAVIKAVNKRIPVIAGTGSNSTEEAVRLTREAEKSGADGALMISPYYNRPTQEGIYQHYKKVASESRHSDHRLQYSRTHRIENRAGNSGAAGGNQKHRRRERSDRLGGPGDRRDPLVRRSIGGLFRRRLADFFSDGAGRQRRDLDGRQCRAEGNRTADAKLA